MQINKKNIYFRITEAPALIQVVIVDQSVRKPVYLRWCARTYLGLDLTDMVIYKLFWNNRCISHVFMLICRKYLYLGRHWR